MPKRDPTERQAEVVELRRSGLNNLQIAERLGLSERAVTTLIYRAKKAGMEVPKSPYNRRG